MSLGVGGTSLWAVDVIQADVVNIDLATGNVISITSTNSPAKSVIVAGGYTAAGCPPPCTPPDPQCYLSLNPPCPTAALFEIPGGIPDEFCPPTEPANSVVGHPSCATAKPFDDLTIDQFFCHTFTGLPSDMGAAVLEIRLKAGSSSQASNDTINLQWAGGASYVWGRFIGAGNPAPGLLPANQFWTPGRSESFCLDLSALPNADGTTTDILPHINATGQLDILVQDDTAVDYAILLLAPCPCVDPPSFGMVAWWTLDEPTGPIAYDSWGSNNGTHVNGPTPTPFGKVDGALSFSGSVANVTVPTSSTLDPASGAFSIDLWAHTVGGGNFTGQYLVTKWDASGLGYAFQLNTVSLTDNRLSGLSLVMTDTNSNSCFASVTFPPLPNQFHHCAVTVSAVSGGMRTVTFYVDGLAKLPVSQTVACANLTNTDPLLIGIVAAGQVPTEIDEVEIFDRVLTPTEILEIFQANSAGKCKCEPLPDGSDCTEVVCPNPAVIDPPPDICRPTQMVYGPSGGQSTVTECDCGCWIRLNDVTFEPLYCGGGTCPNGKPCKLTATPNANGTTTYDCCRPCLETLPSGMVAWWPLDETMGAPKVNDVAHPPSAPASTVNDYGIPKPAGVVGAPSGPEPVVGVVDGALQFPGGAYTDYYVEVPVPPTVPSTDLDLGTGDFSIDAWIFMPLPHAPAQRFPIVDKFDPGLGTGTGFVFGFLGRLYLDINGTRFDSGSFPLENRWAHVGVTVQRNPAEGIFYVDGAPSGATFTPPAGTVNNGLPLWIGNSRLYFADTEFKIDELEIFKRALQPAEILDIFNRRGAGKCKCDPGLTPRRCCLPNGSCIVTSQECCAEFGGTFDPAFAYCLGDFNPPPNGNGIDDACERYIINCDDNRFCNGVETYDPNTGECQPGNPPCTANQVCDEDADTCVESPSAIPTVSQWGLVVMALIGLVAGTMLFRRGRLARV